MTIALLETVTVPAPDAEPPKRKASNGPDETTRAEIVARIVEDLRGGYVEFGAVFAEYDDMEQKPLIDAATAIWQDERAERQAEQRRVVAEALAKTDAETKPCATCGEPLGHRAASHYTTCQRCDDAVRAAQEAAERDYKAQMPDWTLTAYDRADALYAQIGADEDRLVLMLAKEIATWDGVRQYDAHGLAEKATKHALEQAELATLTPKGATPRGMHPSHGAMYWRVVAWTRTHKMDPLDQVVLHALLSHHNGKTGRCDPGYRLLATETHVTTKTVLRSVRTLEKAGAIAIEDRGDGRSFAYSFTLA